MNIEEPLHHATHETADNDVDAPATAESLLLLKRYDYVGPHAKDADVIAAADNYLRTTNLAIEAEEIRNHEYIEQFNALADSVQELGKDLGLDLRDRLRSSDYVHLYQESEYAVVRRQFNRDVGSVAVHSTSGHMLALEGETPLATLANINHELVHVTSRKSIRPEVEFTDNGDTSITTLRSHDGYASHRHDSFDAINEVLTEMTNIDLIRNYWPGHGELSDAAKEPYENIGYQSQLILFDELLKDRFDNPREVFKQLQKGMFTGEMGALRIVTETVGTDIMHKIATLDAVNIDNTMSLAQELGLGEALRKIKANETEELLAWL